MKIIKPYYELTLPASGTEMLKTIERAARTCYKSEDRITDDSAAKLVSSLIARGHEAMLEHVGFTVKFVCDRGVSHELVRHRIASFAQESTRYCNYTQGKFDGELTFIKPCFWNYDLKKDYDNSMMYQTWEFAMKDAEDRYKLLINRGATPQEARSVLPNSIKTEVIMTANVREFRHFLKLRTAKEAHPQMRELTIPLLAELKSKVLVLFDDIESP